MRINPIIAVMLLGGAVALVGALWERRPLDEVRARARRPLTTLEQAFYLRLVEAFPEYIVLAQVGLTALVTTPQRLRSRYRHKVVDFVLLDRLFEVRAAIDLDEHTQASRHALGEPVAGLLQLAGYRVLEFDHVPEVAELRQLLDAPAPGDALRDGAAASSA